MLFFLSFWLTNARITNGDENNFKFWIWIWIWTTLFFYSHKIAVEEFSKFQLWEFFNPVSEKKDISWFSLSTKVSSTFVVDNKRLENCSKVFQIYCSNKTLKWNKFDFNSLTFGNYVTKVDTNNFLKSLFYNLQDKITDTTEWVQWLLFFSIPEILTFDLFSAGFPGMPIESQGGKSTFWKNEKNGWKKGSCCYLLQLEF